MKLRELFRLAVGGLWRQKVRTILTLIGVTIGTCALAFSLALGFGLRAFIENEFKSRDDFWRIIVHLDEPQPDKKDVLPKNLEPTGDISDARKARLREAILDRYLARRPQHAPVMLNPENLAAISALPDVEEIRIYRSGDGRLRGEDFPKAAMTFSTSGRLKELEHRLIEGRLPEAGAKEIVVSELVLHDLGRGSDADLKSVMGLPVTLEVGGVRIARSMALARALTGRLPIDELTTTQAQLLEKLVGQLPDKLEGFDLTVAERAALKRLLEPKPDSDERPFDSSATATDTYRICGVVRVMSRAERKKLTPLDAVELAQAGAFLATDTGEQLFGQLPWAKTVGLRAVNVRVRPGGDLPATVAAIEAMGFKTFSAGKWFASAKREVTLIAMGLNLFALIALFVAGIGITNTLVTSVVERTKEIGILRAVGATRGQILGLFLTEGAFIGVLGSLLGLALARGLAFPADDWVHGVMERQMDMEGEKLLTPTVFVFPSWLWIGSVVFAVVVTTISAYYPARRASRIHPIEALRYG